ncbi:MAG: prepilin-type N-terminal cleavage/methylation domain-containing protein [Nitrospirae bacterium]|nr:prepilin-type N-terminal cleavage/methylation domain-containing protein [Nitrospirota bacterium]
MEKPAVPKPLCQRRKKCSPSCHSRNGFTLLELMISLVMLGVIVLIISSALRLGVRTVSTGEKKIDHLERTRASFNIVDSQIQSQIPLTYEENGEKKYYFQGDRESLRFPSNFSLWGGQKGYVMVRYKVESDNTGKQLLAVSENILGTNNSRESRLFSAVDAMHFEYFFKDPTEEKGKWADRWTDTGNIPEKIRLHLIYGEKEISMVIPMRTSGPLSQTTSARTTRKQGSQ